MAGAPLLAVTAPAVAQDSHYWTQQFGPRSTLLGGAVIGSVNDVSATFYNPGALALATDLAFAVSTSVFGFTTVTVEDGGGANVDLGTTKSGLMPSLVAGTIKRDMFGGAGVLAYSAINRSRGRQNLRGAVFLTSDDLPPESDLQDVAGGVEFTGRYNDFWAGLTYSHALGNHVGLGVTWYGAFRSQNRARRSTALFAGTDGSGLSAVDDRSLEYSALRTLFSFGGYFGVGAITGGLKVTTPSIHLTGSGQLGVAESTIGTDTTAFLAGIQTDLPAEYRSPLSVGGGMAWSFGSARLHGSLEWFDAIDPYVVIQGDSLYAQVPDGEGMVPEAVTEQSDILNWGLALEYAFSEALSGYLSFRQDNSALGEDVERNDLSGLPVDIRNLTLGTDFAFRSARLTLGIGYGWGSETAQGLTEVLREEDPDFEATYAYRSIRLLFGFEIGVD